MTPHLWRICRGEVLTPEKCEAYRENWLRLKDGKPDASMQEALGREVSTFIQTDDPTLIGNVLERLFAAVGAPPCGGCESRKAWLNKAHQWLRSTFPPPSGTMRE